MHVLMCIYTYIYVYIYIYTHTFVYASGYVFMSLYFDPFHSEHHNESVSTAPRGRAGGWTASSSTQPTLPDQSRDVAAHRCVAFVCMECVCVCMIYMLVFVSTEAIVCGVWLSCVYTWVQAAVRSVCMCG